MADFTFDTMLEAGIGVQPLATWDANLREPDRWSTPELLRNIDRLLGHTVNRAQEIQVVANYTWDRELAARVVREPASFLNSMQTFPESRH